MNIEVRVNKKGSYEAGKKRISDILNAAQSVLISGGYAQLTLRRVAGEAGLQLRHLQYYFKTKDQLLAALIKHVCDSYIQKSRLLIEQSEASPKEQFLKCIDYLIEDNKDVGSNTLFFEFWAMACHDEFVNQQLDELYIAYREFIASLIAEWRPGLSDQSVNRRALQIVILLEGATLFIGRNKPKHRVSDGIEHELRKNIIRIAEAPED